MNRRTLHLSAISRVAAGALVCLLACRGADARTATDFFVQAPDNVIGLIQKNSRLDMIDYFSGGLETPTANAFDGKSRIESADNKRLVVAVSDRSRIEVAVVPLAKGDTAVAVIETVSTPALDSSVALYRARDWKPLPAVSPSMKDFMPRDAKSRGIGAADMPPFLFISAEYDPSTQTFVFTNNTDSVYRANDPARPKALAIMKKSIRRSFDGRKFISNGD